MERAKRARKAETPRQPSLFLRLRAPYFYPDHKFAGPEAETIRQGEGRDVLAVARSATQGLRLEAVE